MRPYTQITCSGRRARHAGVALLVAFATLSPPAQSQDGARSGKDVVDAVCAACHATGTDGAPKIGDSGAWAPRASLGLTNLTLHALQGIRNMPAHGGQPELSDLEIARAVTYMVNQSGGNWIEPVSRAALAAERSGKQVVEAQCANCHDQGINGAPKIGDLDAWVQRMKQGLSYLVSSAIHGHGGMPPRGGKADLTDAEIHSAILYMYYPAGPPTRPASGAAESDRTARADPNHKSVEGIDIYLGFMPVEKLRALPEGSPERTMHGGLPEGSGYFHINVSLFDEESQAPIKDARVQLELKRPGMTGTVSQLQSMVIGVGSYGSYLKPRSGAEYDVTVRIDRPGSTRAVIAHFEHRFE